MPTLSRNFPCPCNSGLRYKHCCGTQRDLNRHPPSTSKDLRLDGLELQRQGRFAEAIHLYDSVLKENACDWDVAHMRAVALYQLGLIPESRAAFAKLLPTPAAELPAFWTNLGLLVAAISTDPLSTTFQGGLTELCLYGPTPVAQAFDTRTFPTISVVMPAYNHAAYVEQAIASVFSQSRLPTELIVIDDGSTDNTAEVCRRALASAPIPVTFISRENRGAPTTLNEAIGIANGEFIQPINSDDMLPANRVEAMLSALLERVGDWGFARATYLDSRGDRLDPAHQRQALSLTGAQDSVVMSRALGLGLLRANAAISSGNLTFRKTLWQTLGGFRDYRYNHDWDFCLRASLESEPVVVPKPLYEYRIHATNTITENASAPRIEHKRMMAEFIAYSWTRHSWPNPLAPTLANWGQDYLALLGATDSLQYLPIAFIEEALGQTSVLQG
jgi:glycosyltransferase involved in cell wall biosynthesis